MNSNSLTEEKITSEHRSSFEEIEQLRRLAYQNAEEAIRSGNVQAATEWSRLSIRLTISLVRLSKDGTLEDEQRERQSPWQQWWESVDEIIFLFIGITIGLFSEVLASLFHPLIPLTVALVILIIIMVFISRKKKKLTDHYS